MVKAFKPRSCRYCKQRYIPERTGQIICSNLDCAIGWSEKIATKRSQMVAKADRKVTRERKEKLKTRSNWIKETQIEFNRYIRIRDAHLGCISCGTDLSSEIVGGGYDAGHFLSRGSSPHLRFVELNCHAQCKRCNRYLSGNVANYRVRLIARIGIQAVESLEADNEPRHYTIDQLKEIKKHYAHKCKDLLKLRESS